MQIHILIQTLNPDHYHVLNWNNKGDGKKLEIMQIYLEQHKIDNMKMIIIGRIS